MADAEYVRTVADRGTPRPLRNICTSLLFDVPIIIHIAALLKYSNSGRRDVSSRSPKHTNSYIEITVEILKTEIRSKKYI